MNIMINEQCNSFYRSKIGLKGIIGFIKIDAPNLNPFAIKKLLDRFSWKIRPKIKAADPNWHTTFITHQYSTLFCATNKESNRNIWCMKYEFYFYVSYNCNDLKYITVKNICICNILVEIQAVIIPIPFRYFPPWHIIKFIALLHFDIRWRFFFLSKQHLL